jgi:hypothetical protein
VNQAHRVAAPWPPEAASGGWGEAPGTGAPWHTGGSKGAVRLPRGTRGFFIQIKQKYEVGASRARPIKTLPSQGVVSFQYRRAVTDSYHRQSQLLIWPKMAVLVSKYASMLPSYAGIWLNRVPKIPMRLLWVALSPLCQRHKDNSFPGFEPTSGSIVDLPDVAFLQNPL